MEQEFVTLPREVVERALEAMSLALSDVDWRKGSPTQPVIHKAYNATRAALDRPQNHVPDAGNMVPAGWKLVPVEPNCSMVLAGERSLEQHDFLRLDSAYRAMLDAAPKPPTVKDSLTVDQPQSEQPAMTPIAQRKLDDLVASGYTISGYSVYHEQKHQHGFVTVAGLVGWWRPGGMEYPQPRGERGPVAEIIGMDEYGQMLLWHKHWAEFPIGTKLYTHPQPKRNPLTDEQIDAIAEAMPGGLEGFMKGWG